MKILFPLGAEWTIHKKYFPTEDISIYYTSWVVTMHKVPVHTPKLYFMLTPDSGKLFLLAHAVVNVIADNTMLI